MRKLKLLLTHRRASRASIILKQKMKYLQAKCIMCKIQWCPMAGVKNMTPWDFPGGTVVKNPPANAGDTGSSPGPGRSHMPWSN